MEYKWLGKDIDPFKGFSLSFEEFSDPKLLITENMRKKLLFDGWFDIEDDSSPLPKNESKVELFCSDGEKGLWIDKNAFFEDNIYGFFSYDYPEGVTCIFQLYWRYVV